MAIKKFNSIDGFSVGSDTPIAVIDNVANVTANSLVVSNKSNLGNVGNITITGGSPGYVLKTDGAGNLSWGIDTAAAGGSNTQVQFNDGGSLSGNGNFTFNKSTSVLTLTGNLVTVNANLGNLATANYFNGNGTYLTSITGSNVTGQVGNALVAGTVYTNAQPNITSVGTLSSLAVSNTVTAGNAIIGLGSGGNITGANLISANYFVGDGSLLTGLPAGYANSNVANYLPVYTGNVSANYFIGNGSTLTYITGANVTGYVSNATNANTANTANTATTAGTVYTNAQPNITSVGTLSSLAVTATVTAGNAIIGLGSGGNITGANLISANYFSGDGSLLTNINAGNITGAYSNTNVAAYLPTYTGNVSANYFIGNGSTLTFITGANVSGNVNSAVQSHYANIANSVAGANVTGQVSNALVAGTVYTAAQPNITSVGTLLGLSVTGNLNITGNIIATGNLNYSNVTDLIVGDPLIYLGANNTGNLYDLGFVASYNDGTYYHTGLARDASDGTWKLFDTVVAEPTTVIDFANGTYAPFKSGAIFSTGNISGTNANLGNLVVANYFSGDGSLLTNINAGNITGLYSNANVANYLPTYTGNVSANYFIGNGSTLTYITGSNVIGNVDYAITSNWANTANNISGSNVSGNVADAVHAYYADTANSVAGSNVTGQVGNALIAGTVYTNAQPNITSVGTLSSLSVTGNITSSANSYAKLFGSSSTSLAVPGPGNVAGERVRLYDFGSLSSTNYAIGVEDHYIWTAVDATTAGFKWYGGNTLAATLIANGQFTTVGNINSANANLGNLVVANYFSGDGSLLTNINAGNITGLYSNANVANYLPTYTGNVSANYFIGNGSTLTDITGANVTGNVTFSITSNWANVANSVSGTNVSGTVANATYATSAGSADSATTAGTVTTAAQPNITSTGTLTELTVNGLTDLGPVGNITITGGTSGYVLTTNGSGDLSWQAAGGSAGPGFVNITKNSFTGNGVQTIFTLTTTPASEASLLVNIDGITQQDSAYSLSGSDVTFSTAPFAGEIVEIVSYGSIGIGSNTTVLFNDNGDIGNVATFSFNKGSNTLSVTNIDTSSISFDSGVITVAGANAGIFTSGVDNINFGLGANVTVGSTSGNTTVQGNLIAGNISTSSNLSITGTATITNLKVNDFYSNRTPVSVTTNTVVDSFSVNRYRSAKYTMRINSDDGYQAVEVLLIHDGSTSYVTIYGSLSTIGTDIVTLSSNILSGNVRLLATTASANTTVNLLGTYVAD